MSDLDSRCFVKRRGALVPADIVSDEFMADIKEGKEVLVTIRRARNPKHHRLLFALLNKVIENTDQWASVDVLLDELKLATGLAEIRVNLLTGKPYAVPGSISFAAMGQEKFSPWFEIAVTMLATSVLKVSPAELMAEIEAMTAPRDQQRRAG